MARRKRRSHISTNLPLPMMNPETKRGVGIILLFAVAAIIFLSFFGVAGSLGVWVQGALTSLFGLDRYLVPIVLIMIGVTLSFPERGTFSFWNYLGVFFFFLSFNALLNLLLVNRPEPFATDLALAGGHIGQFLALILPAIVGYWGAITIAAAILFVSILLTFNTSLRTMVGVHTHMFGWVGRLLHRERTVAKEPGEPTEEEEDDDEVLVEETPEEVQEEEDKRAFRTTPVVAVPKEETALVSRQHRQIAIPLNLLERSASKAQSGDIERNKEIIEKTFNEFGIEVEMGKTSVGPTVTQYTLRPSQGVKLARIVSLQNDLALALAAHPLRMEAPIPGQSLVGIEVPNSKVATVALRDVLETLSFKTQSSNLTIPLGKDVSGECKMIALEKMPHLLVAGATGSGKSVCLNTMIVSWLYQNGPDDLKLILVDPKRVELTIYNGIPHLLVPPITNVDDTVNALKWTVREMERRLDILSKFGARDIAGYNARAQERMPKIVVVIDELADLMSASGREVEATIVRIAQIARAVGIHLVLATQRPSVDVITGLIKANIPGRIAFAVASQTDSRTILDQSGAEKLLGRGDMLFTCAELAKPKRLQGAYLSVREIERVVSFLRHRGEPDYNMAITEITKAGTVFDDPQDGDPMLEEAIRVVLESGKASTSFLQRRLRLGYARAARVMDLMEQAGVVGPGSGARPREILVDSWPPAEKLEVGGWRLEERMSTMQDDLDEVERNLPPSTHDVLPTDDTVIPPARQNLSDGGTDPATGGGAEGSEREKTEGKDEDDPVDWETAVDDSWVKQAVDDKSDRD